MAFETKPLRELCEDETRAVEKLTDRVAIKLRRRIADLRAAASMNDLVASKCHELDGAFDGHMAIELCDGFRIVICPNNRIVPKTKLGKINWAGVNRIKIVRIENE